MPRKVGLPPTIFKIESLSTGREIRPGSAGLDDFTGQPIDRVQDDSPIRELPDAQELQDERNRAKRAAAKALLELVKPKPVMVAPKVEGMRPIGKLGERVIYVHKADWRRI
jgi:hypothetical protein